MAALPAMNLPARFAFSLRWRVTAFLACAALVNYADRAALSSVLPSLRHELGLSDVQLGLLSSLFLWSYALGSPLAGMLADRVSRARIIFWSLATWSLVTAFMGFASNFAVLAGLRIALGLAECLYVPAAIALLADHHSGATRGRAMSVHSIGLNLGVVVGGAFAGFAADAYGWRSGFWMLGFAGIALAASSRYGLQDGPAALAHRATRAHPREGAALPAANAVLLCDVGQGDSVGDHHLDLPGLAAALFSRTV
jgi:sugar phosphate permease